MTKLQNETYLSFIERVHKALLDKKINLNDWCQSLTGEILYSEENLRRCSQFLTKVLDQLNQDENKYYTSDQRLNDLKNAKVELEKERKRLQTQNAELQATYREQARNEMFQERIYEAINKLTPIDFTDYLVENRNLNQTGVLCIGDAHNGVEINMKTVFGEIVNVYSPDILQNRLNTLIDQIIYDHQNYFNYGNLVIFDLGDGIQNILRLSDLTKLKMGVIDATIQYAEMISQFLNELQNRLEIPIEFYCLGGNHSELRLLTKNRNWDEENLGKVIREFIYLRLINNQHITITPYSNFTFKEIDGINILAIHGDDAKNNLEEISYWEQYHNITIDILIMGHFHHAEQISVGYAPNGDKEIIKVPSLVGIDTFSRKCRKLARAGAKFMLFENGAKSWEKIIYLN